MFTALNNRRSQLKGRLTRRRSAFTLIEIMIVVLIIGILLAIAVPNFVRARESARSKACIDNLKQIDSAKEQYAMDNKLPTGSTAIAADPLTTSGSLVGPTAYLKSTPTCPSGGAYTVNNIGTAPVCTFNSSASVQSYAPHALPYN